MGRNSALATVCGLLLWMGGCPKRQETRQVLVYVPAPAPAANSAPASQQVLVIEQPPPPEPPQETVTPKAPPPAVTRRQGFHSKPKTTAEPEEETEVPDAPETPPAAAEVPALEPRESSAQENALRGEYQRLDHDIRQRLARLNGARLTANDRRTLADARAFFAQAGQAMSTGDLPRALNLARKASLLLAALE